VTRRITLKEAVDFSSFRLPLRRVVVTVKVILEDQIVQSSAGFCYTFVSLSVAFGTPFWQRLH